MSREQDLQVSTDDKIVTPATEFRECAHIVLPADWEGKLVRVQEAGEWTPPLFQNLSVGKETVIKTCSNDRITGEVIRYDESTKEDTLRALFVLDTGHDFYRVSVERSVASDSWGEDYELEKAVSGEEAVEDTDEVVLMEFAKDNGDETAAMWAPVGEVSGVATMNSV